MTNDGERRKPILDRKTKKETPIKTTGEKKKKKSGSKDREKDSLGQPVDTTGGRTLGTGGAAPAAVIRAVKPVPAAAQVSACNTM